MSGFFALAIAYVLSQFYRSFVPVLTPQLTLDLGVDKSDLSLATGMWFMCFAIMQFVVGIGLDRFGPRRTAALIFGFGTSSGALVFATAQSPAAIVLAMCLIGIGCSPVLMATLYIVAQRFDGAQFAFMTSSVVAFGNLGNIVGASPLAHAVTLLGWRTTMASISAFSFFLGIALFLLIQDPEKPARTGMGHDIVLKDEPSGGLGGYTDLLKMPVLWAILVMTLLCYAPVAGIRGLWAGPYLADLYQATSVQIGHVTVWMAIAMLTGSLLYGPLDRLFDSRKKVVLAGNLAVLAALIYLITNPLAGLTPTTLTFIVIGLCGTSYGVLMAHGRAFLPSHLLGRGVTLLNFCSIFGAGVMQFVTGSAADAQPDPASAASYQLVLILYASTLAVALAIYAMSTDAKPSDTSPTHDTI